MFFLVLIFQCVSALVLEASLALSFVPVNGVRLFPQSPSFTSGPPKVLSLGKLLAKAVVPSGGISFEKTED